MVEYFNSRECSFYEKCYSMEEKIGCGRVHAVYGGLNIGPFVLFLTKQLADRTDRVGSTQHKEWAK